MRSLTPTATSILRAIKADRGIQGVGLFASSGVTRVYSAEGASKHRDYHVQGGVRYGRRAATVRHHENGTFDVLVGGRVDVDVWGSEPLADGISNLETAISIAVDHVVAS